MLKSTSKVSNEWALLRNKDKLAAFFLPSQAENDYGQLKEVCDRQAEQLSRTSQKLQEKTSENEADIKNLKETIFELEDQVEQHRAIKLHNNQLISDLESRWSWKKGLKWAYLGGSVRAATGRRRSDLYKYSSFGYSLLFMHKSTVLTESAVDGTLETVSKPHSSVKEVLPIPKIGITGFLLKSF